MLVEKLITFQNRGYILETILGTLDELYKNVIAAVAKVETTRDFFNFETDTNYLFCKNKQQKNAEVWFLMYGSRFLINTNRAYKLTQI